MTRTESLAPADVAKLIRKAVTVAAYFRGRDHTPRRVARANFHPPADSAAPMREAFGTQHLRAVSAPGGGGTISGAAGQDNQRLCRFGLAQEITQWILDRLS